MNDSKKTILFLCTGNSCRSQMAEGWARELKGDYFDVYSAGVETHGLNPYAVKVMAECHIDIANHESKHVSDLKEKKFNFVVTVCDSAREKCPFYPAETKVIHKGFQDPPKLAEKAKTEEEKLKFYRKVRDEIKAYILTLPDSLYH